MALSGMFRMIRYNHVVGDAAGSHVPRTDELECVVEVLFEILRAAVGGRQTTVDNTLVLEMLRQV